MFFGGDDDEQDFVSAGGGSKLGSLFNLDKSTNVGGNSSLTYTAPKQPKKKGEATDGGGGGNPPSVPIACVVHAYKYVEGRYALQGKLGCALLANAATKDFKILLYISKDKQVTNASITPATTFTVQANNYASFYDDARISWSIMFDTEENAVKFAKQVCLAKAAYSGVELNAVVSQDLCSSDGRGLESGDAAEIRYTGWLYTNGAYGQTFDSNANSDKLFRLKLGKGKVIKGWEMGLIGMKKGGKRMLIIPPNLGYGAQAMGDKIPPNSTLIFEVELVRAKFQKGEQSPAPSPSPAPPPQVPSTVEDDSQELDQTVKGRTKSITEHMTQQGDSGKAKLISRMAKMGKPMLPMPGGGAVPAETGSDDEDAEVEEHTVQEQPVIQKPEPQLPARVQPTPPYQQPQMFTQQPAMSPHPQHSFHQYAPSPAGNQMNAYQPQNYLQAQQQQHPQTNMQMPPQGFQPPGYQMTQGAMMNQSSYPSHSNTPPSGQSLDVFGPVLLTETRQQNTEVRMAISKIADKVDKVYEKVTDIQSTGVGTSHAPQVVAAPNMEVSVLIQNVTRIAQENEHLKKDVFEKSSKIEAQNDKIAELLHKNQRFVEQSNTLLEERNEGYKHSASQSQAKVLELEQEKVQLATELSASTAQLSAVQLELANTRKRESELLQKIQSTSDNSSQSQEERERLKLQHSEDERKITELNSALREEKQHRKTLESAHNQLQEEYADLKTSKENMERGIADRKRRVTEERKKMEEEMEEMKTNYEQEIQTLRDKLRKQKTTTDSATTDKLSRIEAEIQEEWKIKSDKLLAAANEKYTRSLKDLKEETNELQDKLKEAEDRMQSLRTASGNKDERINELEEEIEELQSWKVKYDNLRSQATAMKGRYEESISEFEKDNELLTEKIEELEEKLKSGATSVGGTVSGDLVQEVKRIMNNVYRELREEFEAGESYKGSEVLSSLLASIKSTTLQLVKSQQEKVEPEEKDGGSEDEDEEEEEEDETDGNQAEENKSEQIKEEKVPVVEESMTSSDVIVMESAPITHAAPPPTDKTPVTLPVAPAGFTEEHAHITGDKGNRIYSEKLDQSTPLPSGTDSVVEEKVDKVESSQVQSTPPPTSSSSTTSSPTKDTQPVVEEKLGKSETSTLEAGPPSNTPKESPVKPAKISAKKDHPTGDKGNRIYSEKLDKLDDKHDDKHHKPEKHDKLQQQNKHDKQTPVTSKLKEDKAHIVGDKGNKYYTDELDSLKPVVAETFAKSESSVAHAAPPTNKDKPNGKSQVHAVHAPKPKPITPHFTSATAHVTGDKGNRLYSEELDKLQPWKDPLRNPVNETDLEKDSDHIVGDKGNPYHTAALDNSVPPKDATSKTSTDDSKIKENIASNVTSTNQDADKKKDTESKSRTSSINDKTTNQQIDKKSEGREKGRTSSSSSVDNVPTLATKEPPPLFDDDEDSPLFGNDSTVADTFGTDFKPKTEKPKESKDKKDTKKTDKLPSKNDLVDEDDKQPPPPLFGNDSDEEDLNWLS